jgi:hypothetical protein
MGPSWKKRIIFIVKPGVFWFQDNLKKNNFLYELAIYPNGKGQTQE